MLPIKFRFIWSIGFQRRRFKWEKLTADGRQVMAKAHMDFRPGEHKRDQFIY